MIEKSTYKEIFKSTLLFSFVKVISIVVRIVLNKAVAIILGTQGMGMISMLYSSLDIIRVLSGLGISQSAVRDVSKAYAANNREMFSKTIIITQKIIIFTGLLGAFATMLLSPFLSKLSFGSYDYTIAYIFLGIFSFANIINEGQTAIIRGIRNLKALAKSSLFGAIVGLVMGLPLYYIFGEKGIVPSMVLVSLSSMAFSWRLVAKIDYEKTIISLKEIYKESREMIKLGIALTYLVFLGLFSDYLIRAFIAEYGSLEQVGIFQAGVLLLTSYFGIVLTALNTDYYPRMYAVAHDNNELKKQMNMQVNAAFLLLIPILLIFIVFMPSIITLLYSSEFLDVINYLQFAIFGLLINVYTDCLGVVLIAKQESKLFAILISIYRIITIPILIFSYYYWGFKGLGIAAILTPIINFVMIGTIVFKKYGIFYKLSTTINITLLTFFLVFTILISLIKNHSIKYIMNALTFVILLHYTNLQLKRIMNINIASYLQKKIKYS